MGSRLPGRSSRADTACWRLAHRCAIQIVAQHGHPLAELSHRDTAAEEAGSQASNQARLGCSAQGVRQQGQSNGGGAQLETHSGRPAPACSPCRSPPVAISVHPSKQGVQGVGLQVCCPCPCHAAGVRGSLLLGSAGCPVLLHAGQGGEGGHQVVHLRARQTGRQSRQGIHTNRSGRQDKV